MAESNSIYEIKNYPFRDFAALGIIAGGLGPILVFFLIAYCLGIESFKLSGNAFSLILVVTFIVLSITIGLLLCVHKHADKPIFRRFELLQAISCFTLTFIIIFNTGGSRNSVFSFTCLYIPSVVGYVYDKKGDKNLYGAVIAMAFSYLFNLWVHSDFTEVPSPDLIDFSTPHFSWSDQPIRIEFIYAAIFILQLLILMKIAMKKEKSELQSISSM